MHYEIRIGTRADMEDLVPNMSTGIRIMYTEGVDAVVSLRDEMNEGACMLKRVGSVGDCPAARQPELDGISLRRKPLGLWWAYARSFQ